MEKTGDPETSIIDQSNRLPFIEVSVQGTFISALIDTGCNATAVMNYKVFKQIKNRNITLIQTQEQLLGPDKHPLNTYGQAIIPLVIANNAIEIKTIIASITQKLFLGALFLEQTKSKISFDTKTVTLLETVTVPIINMDYPDLRYLQNCRVVCNY